MRKTWRATGSAVGLALAAFQGAAQAQTYEAPQPYVLGAPVAAAPAVVPAPLPTVVAQPVVVAPQPVVVAPQPVAPVVAAPVFAPAPAVVPVQTAGQVIQLAPIDIGGTAVIPPAQAIAVTTETLLFESGPKLDDSLREIPGVFTRTNASQPGVAVNMRGFEGSGRVNTMIDGVRQNFRFTGHEAQGFTYVDPNLLAGVDVARGASTGVGGGALAGSVNFRTLGVDDIVRPGQAVGALGRLTWGGNGVGVANTIGGGLRLGGFGVAGALSFRNSDDYKNGAGVEVANTWQNLVSGLLKAEADFGDHSLNFGGVFYDNRFAANSYNQTLTNRTASAGYRYDPENDLIDLRANLRYNDTEMEYLSAITPSPFTPNAGRWVRSEGVGGDLANRSYAQFGPVDLVSTNGVEYFRDDVSGGNHIDPSRHAGTNPRKGEASTLAAFTDNTLRYGIFDLNAGLRYDRYDLSGSGDVYVGGVLTPYVVDNSEGRLNPSVSLGVEPIQGVRPYVKWSRSMRAPTLQETMMGGSHDGTGGVGFDPNPNLRPEKQQTFEVGAQIEREGLIQPGDRLTASANYYWMDVDDYVVANMYGGQFGGRTAFTNVAGTSKVQGLELEGGYDAGPYFVRAAYSRSESKLPPQLNGFGASQYLPDDTVSVTAGVRLFDEKLTVGGSYNYVSGSKTTGYSPSFNAAIVENKRSYGLVDLFADYKVDDRFRFGLKATNVGDKEYTPWLATSGTGQGRTFYATGEVKF